MMANVWLDCGVVTMILLSTFVHDCVIILIICK